MKKKNSIGWPEFFVGQPLPNLSLLLLRWMAGGMMLTHGIPKLMNFSSLAGVFPDPLGIGPRASLFMIILAEVGCSLLLIAGLFTRLATLPLIFAMSIAAFFTAPEFAFSTSEMALLYMAMFVVILLAGPGKCSVDWLMARKHDPQHIR